MKTVLAALAMVVLAIPSRVTARDDRLKFPIADAMSTPAAREKLRPDVWLYFGEAPHPEVVQKLGETVVNLKTNAFGKSDQAACQWVFLSVVIELQKRAREAGGNAVIGIESYYKKEVFTDEKLFMCGAGAMVAGVAFRGTIVKLAPDAPREPLPPITPPKDASPVSDEPAKPAQ